jgi:hypothetical protein
MPSVWDCFLCYHKGRLLGGGSGRRDTTRIKQLIEQLQQASYAIGLVGGRREVEELAAHVSLEEMTT